MIDERRAAVDWWRDLQPNPDAGRSGDRATLARLRRCATVAQLMLEPAVITLFRRCGAESERDLPRIALTAGVLAHVRGNDDSVPVARQVGPDTPDKPETARLKPLRFRVLMEAHTGDERLTAFRRLVALADGKLNVADLAAALLAWTEERRRRWVFTYWNAGPPPQSATSAITPVPAKETAA
jgi:CRISPR system Cascade subunit CasB